MKYTCKYCKETLELKSSQAAGHHVSNCKDNPNYELNYAKRKSGAIKANTVERFELTKECPSCKQNFTLFLTESRMKTKDNITYCSRPCFNRRHISLETRAKLAEAAKHNIDNPKRIDGVIQAFKKKRFESQQIGREKIKLGDPLYIAGCMLYWGEGSKGTNSSALVNCDPYMLKLYLSFLRTYWDIDETRLAIRINCYTDLASIEEIENYWLKMLPIERSHFRGHTINNNPVSSKNIMKKSKYGTVTITYSDTKIVQEIFGAIQEFGGFTDERWLDTAAQRDKEKSGASSQVRTDDMADGNRPLYQTEL
jgi:hypothetical protein